MKLIRGMIFLILILFFLSCRPGPKTYANQFCTMIEKYHQAASTGEKAKADSMVVVMGEWLTAFQEKNRQRSKFLKEFWRMADACQDSMIRKYKTNEKTNL